jgi:hypothetical protein
MGQGDFDPLVRLSPEPLDLCEDFFFLGIREFETAHAKKIYGV